MDAEVLKTVGQVAGIGGIALGVFLLLFREIIRKSIFPTLTRAHAYSLLRLSAVLIWSVALAGIGAWAWVETFPRAPERAPAVQVQGGVGAGRDLNVGGDITIGNGPSSRSSPADDAAPAVER